MRTRPIPGLDLLSLAALSLLLLSSLAVATTGAAQTQPLPDGSVLYGRVVREGTGVAGTPVTLHRITQQSAGEIASTATADDGTFSFPLELAAGAGFNVFFVTAEYLSVRFFGEPVQPDSAGVRDYLVEVFDTTSVLAEPIRVQTRDVVMIGELTGGWEVLEVLVVNNPNPAAYVAAGGMPSWQFNLPDGVTDFQVGQGDVLPHELNRMDDRVLHLTPVTPGAREIFISYRIPPRASRTTIRIDEPTDTFNVFVRRPSRMSSVSGLQTTRIVSSEGEEFLQYGGVDLQPGARIDLQWTRPEGPPVDPVLAAVAVTLFMLGVGAVAAIRNRAPGT